MSHKIGYARVSTVSQNIESQLDTLNKAGCIKVFSDTVSDFKETRPGWHQLMHYYMSRGYSGCG